MTRSTETNEQQPGGWQWCVWAVVCIGLCSGCATSQEVGVRSDYRDRDIQQLAVWPVYSAGSFDADEGALANVKRSAETETVAWLKDRGRRVVAPHEVASMPIGEMLSSEVPSSAQNRTRTPFDIFEVELEQRYNPEERHRPSQSARLLKQLYDRGALGARYVLFGRIIYHTETSCRVRADHYYHRAEVAFASGVSRRLPNRCVVTFLQFKLVDVQQGATVWFNEGLREFHVQQVSEEKVRENTARLVDRLLGGDDGLGGLIGREE